MPVMFGMFNLAHRTILGGICVTPTVVVTAWYPITLVRLWTPRQDTPLASGAFWKTSSTRNHKILQTLSSTAVIMLRKLVSTIYLNARTEHCSNGLYRRTTLKERAMLVLVLSITCIKQTSFYGSVQIQVNKLFA